MLSQTIFRSWELYSKPDLFPGQTHDYTFGFICFTQCRYISSSVVWLFGFLEFW